MAINPNISLAVKGIEVQDPLAQYGRVAAIQGAQQQNQLAQLQMQNLQREQEYLLHPRCCHTPWLLKLHVFRVCRL